MENSSAEGIIMNNRNEMRNVMTSFNNDSVAVNSSVNAPNIEENNLNYEELHEETNFTLKNQKNNYKLTTESFDVIDRNHSVILNPISYSFAEEDSNSLNKSEVLSNEMKFESTENTSNETNEDKITDPLEPVLPLNYGSKTIANRLKNIFKQADIHFKINEECAIRILTKCPSIYNLEKCT